LVRSVCYRGMCWRRTRNRRPLPTPAPRVKDVDAVVKAVDAEVRVVGAGVKVVDAALVKRRGLLGITRGLVLRTRGLRGWHGGGTSRLLRADDPAKDHAKAHAGDDVRDGVGFH